MSKRVKWTEIEEELVELGKPALIRLLKQLYNASTDNQAFFVSRFSEEDVTPEAREPYRKRITHQFFPKRGFGKLDLRLARQAIRDYRRATLDIAGTADLMLTYVENGTRFTNTYGDIEESFYNSMVSVLSEAVKLIEKNPTLFPQFHDRLETLVYETSGIGWGYGDDVHQIVGELKAQFDTTKESEQG